VSPLAEISAKTGGQTDTGFAILVAQSICGGQSVFPALLAGTLEEVELIGLRGEG
jgi:hypothetical protein